MVNLAAAEGHPAEVMDLSFALQALAVVSHVMNLFILGPSKNAFYTVLSLTSYGILVALAIGTFWAWQERRAAGLE